MGKHFWESDEDHAGRVNQEANEKVVEESTGRAPSQRFWEDKSDYRDRISRQATEQTIENSTGSAPSQRILESDGDYRARISCEANRRIVTDFTGSSPSQRIWESDEGYHRRISLEANKQTIERATGSPASKGLFESDSDYRQRLYVEAREIRASRDSGGNGGNSSSAKSAPDDYRASSGPSSGNSGAVWGIILVCFVVAAILGTLYNSMQTHRTSEIPSRSTQASKALPNTRGLRSSEDRRQHQLVANARQLLGQHNYAAALGKCNEALVLRSEDPVALQLKKQIESEMTPTNTQLVPEDTDTLELNASRPAVPAGQESMPQNEVPLSSSSPEPVIVPPLPPISAPSSSPSPELSSANAQGATELLAKVQIALGGNDLLSSIRDWRRDSKDIWEPRKGTSHLTTYFTAPSTIRTEVVGGNKVVDFSDGESGWSWSSSSGAQRDLPRATASGMILHTLPALLLNDNSDQRASLVAPGVVEFSNQFHDTARLTIDLTTYLPAKLTWTNLDGARLEESYSKWNRINGVLWWFEMTRSRDGVVFLRERVEDYRLNVGTPATALAMHP